ncbi:Urb2 domain-containing protein [Chloropicon primus]|nr:Urb2 domain-containing protein [Chloropicon primus]
MGAQRLPNPARAWKEPKSFHEVGVKCCEELDHLRSQPHASSSSSSTPHSIPFGGHFAVRLRARQVARWAAESLGSLAKKGSKDGGGSFHSFALWNVVTKGMEIDANAVEQVTISLVRAVSHLAGDWSERRQAGSLEEGQEEIARALHRFTVGLIGRRDGINREPFFLSGGIKLALDLLGNVISCYKVFDDAGSSTGELWELLCVQILRESRLHCSSQELSLPLAANEKLYLNILSLLEASDKVASVLKAKVADGTKESLGKDHSLHEEALLWIQRLYFPEGCISQYEGWLASLWESCPVRTTGGLSACVQHMLPKAIQKKDAKNRERLYLLELTLNEGLRENLPGAAEVLPWIVFCFHSAWGAEIGTKPQDKARSALDCRVQLDSEGLPLSARAQYLLSILVGCHLIHHAGGCLNGEQTSPRGERRFENAVKALDALHALYHVMERKRLYHRVDDPKLSQLAVLTALAKQVSRMFSVESLESSKVCDGGQKIRLCEVALKCLMQMSKVDLRITEKEMTHLWCLVWISNSRPDFANLDFEFLLSPFTSRRDNSAMIETLYESLSQTFVRGGSVIRNCKFFKALGEVAQSAAPIAVPDMIRTISDSWMDMVVGKDLPSAEAYLSLSELLCTVLDHLKVVKQNALLCSRACRSMFERMQSTDVWAELKSSASDQDETRFCSLLKEWSKEYIARISSLLRVHSSLVRIFVDCEMAGFAEDQRSRGEEPPSSLSSEIIFPIEMTDLSRTLLNLARFAVRSGVKTNVVANFRFVCCASAIQYMSIGEFDPRSVEQSVKSSGERHSEVLFSTLTDQVLSSKGSHKRWNGLISSVDETNVYVAMYHLMSSTFSHWSHSQQGGPNKHTDDLMKDILKCLQQEERGGEGGGMYLTQVKATTLKLFEKMSQSRNTEIRERLLQLTKSQLEICLGREELRTTLSEKIWKYRTKYRNGEKKMEQVVKQVQDHVIGQPFGHKRHSNIELKERGWDAYNLITSSRLRALIHCIDLCLRRSELDSELVSSVCVHMTLVEGIVLDQIDALSSISASTRKSQCIKALSNVLCRTRKCMMPVLLPGFKIGSRKRLSLQKWAVGSIVCISDRLATDLTHCLSDFLEIVGVTYSTELKELSEQFLQSPSSASEDDLDYFGFPKGKAKCLSWKAAARAVRYHESSSEDAREAIRRFQKDLVREIMEVGERRPNDRESPKRRKLSGGHTTPSGGVVGELLYVESLIDAYVEIITYHSSEKSSSYIESSLEHIQCAKSILMALVAKAGCPFSTDGDLNRLQRFIWRKFLHFLELSIELDAAQLTSSALALRKLTVFLKLRTQCEAALNHCEMSSRRLTGKKHVSWSLAALECYFESPTSSLWLRARTQDKKCLRIQSNYADVHINCLLNDLPSCGSPKVLEEHILTFISIVSWAPSMKLRVNTIGRLLCLPLSLFGTTSGAMPDAKQECNIVATCCRLIHGCVKFRGNQCRRSAALIIQSSSCLQSKILSVESLIAKQVENADGSGAQELDDLMVKLRSAASYVCDLYKELASQSENFGKYLVHVLSSYVFLEHGDMNAGDKSEITLILESGICTLLGSCPPKDLKHLHTVFLGKRDSGNYMEKLKKLHTKYEMHFKYQGKK